MSFFNTATFVYLKYRNHPNTRLVLCWSSQNMSGCQIVWYTDENMVNLVTGTSEYWLNIQMVKIKLHPNIATI